VTVFSDARLTLAVRAGATWSEDYDIEIVRSAAGSEWRRARHPLPMRRWELSFALMQPAMAEQVIRFYHRMFGRLRGFRLNHPDDRSTAADGRSAPAASDQTLTRLSAGVYQLVKRYGGGPPAERPPRTLYKPVAGSAVVAVGGTAWATGWTLDTTTGQIAFSANLTKAITGISKAASAVIDFGSAHPFTPGQTVHVGGVAGMTEINGQRAAIESCCANTNTVAINSSGYGTYTSGGTANTQPQSTETVTGGCLFDLPVRFDSDLAINGNGNVRTTGTIAIVELLAP